jgi:hypothetical protein
MPSPARPQSRAYDPTASTRFVTFATQTTMRSVCTIEQQCDAIWRQLPPKEQVSVCFLLAFIARTEMAGTVSLRVFQSRFLRLWYDSGTTVPLCPGTGPHPEAQATNGYSLDSVCLLRRVDGGPVDRPERERIISLPVLPMNWIRGSV